MSPYTVRRIKAKEWRELREVRLAALRDSPSAFGSTVKREQSFDDERWQTRALSSASGSLAITLIAEGQAQGWVALVTVLGPKHEAVQSMDMAELFSMWVDPNYRGMGLGKELLRQAILFCNENKTKFLELDVTHGNIAALKLYRASGFLKVEESICTTQEACAGEQHMRLVLQDLK